MRERITGVILAGGCGERLGGVDKALLSWSNQSFLDHIAQALQPQVSRIVVSVRSTSAAYAGYETVIDASDGADGNSRTGEGPLGGLLAGLRVSRTPLTLFAPCDNPTPPHCLAERLVAALGANDIAYATHGDDRHWLYAVIRTELQTALTEYWQAGGRAPHRWYAQQKSIAVPFDDLPASAFRNINTPAELAQLKKTDSELNSPRR